MIRKEHSASQQRTAGRVAALCMPLLFGAATIATAEAQSRGNGPYYNGGDVSSVRCESINNRPKECRLDGRARLVRQLSGSACVEGRSWGQGRGGVWVNHGCRAEFVSDRGRPSRPGHGNGHGNGYGNGWGSSAQVVDCDSNDRRQRRCNMTIRSDARLLRQKSGSACIEGQSWGWDRNGLWVSNGCRGQFQVR